MAFKEYADYDGLGLAALVGKGEVSPGELVEAAIERIERHNGVLNAVVHKAYDEARGDGGRRPAGRAVPRRALPDQGPGRPGEGLAPDLGQPVRAGGGGRDRQRAGAAVSPGRRGAGRQEQHAGVRHPGRHQFGRLGACRNPWNPDHISGGSSGGAASATAAGIVPLAHASDGLGSIRIPAACCGLVGMKITRDRTPICEVSDGALGFSVHHVVSRSVRDSAAMLDATGYVQAGDPFEAPAKAGPYLDEVTKSPGKLRIAWSAETPSGRPIPDEMLAALMRTVELLKGLGHDVFEQGLGIDYRLLYRAQGLASASNFSANVQRWVEKLGREPGDDDLGPLARRGYEAGKRVTGQQAFWGFQQLRLMNRQILAAFEGFDVYLTPVMSTPAPRVDC